MWLLCYVLTTAVIAAAIPLSAQMPQFRGSTTLVPLDVRVLDKNGQPVRGLAAVDFKIAEDGVPQEVRHFSTQELTAEAAESGGPLVRRGAQTGELAPSHRRVFLIYLGRGELRGPANGIEGVIHLVRDRLLPQDYVAILAWNCATDFTTDRASTLALLDRFKGGYRQVETQIENWLRSPVYIYGDRRIPGYIQKNIDTIFRGPLDAPVRTSAAQLQASAAEEQKLLEHYDLYNAREADAFARMEREMLGVDLPTFLQDTAQTLQDRGNLFASIEYLRHVEGEKHLVWLTEVGLRTGFLTPVEFDEAVGRAAADARVVLNIVRAGGTETGHGAPGAAESQRPARVTGTSAMALLLPAATSRIFAELTGGRSDANRHRNAAEDVDYIDQATRSQYLLGYYPTNPDWNGRFRKVKVTVNRPDVTVLVRGGYYAKNEVGALDRESVATFSRIAAAAGDVREIPDLRLQASATTSADRKTVEMHVTVSLGRVIFTRNADGANTASLEVAAFALSSKQKPVGDVRQTIAFTYPDERLAAAKQADVPVTLTVPISAPADSVKLVVYQFAGDLTGSLNIKVGK